MRDPAPEKAPVPAARKPKAEPAQVAAKASDLAGGWVRVWGTNPDSRGGVALPAVPEVLEWLNWATCRYRRKRAFDDVFLRRHGGDREAPPGGRMAREDHKRILRAIIHPGWPDRDSGWRPFMDGGAVLRVTDADTNGWFPRAPPSTHGATAQGICRCRSPSLRRNDGASDGSTAHPAPLQSAAWGEATTTLSSRSGARNLGRPRNQMLPGGARGDFVPPLGQMGAHDPAASVRGAGPPPFKGHNQLGDGWYMGRWACANAPDPPPRRPRTRALHGAHEGAWTRPHGAVTHAPRRHGAPRHRVETVGGRRVPSSH